MAGLKAVVNGLLEERHISGLDRMRAVAALQTLINILGDVDERCLSLPTSSEVGNLVNVPGETSLWLVFGTYDDGTYDIIREGSIKASDRMYGWKRGQSRKVYENGLESDPDLALPTTEEKNQVVDDDKKKRLKEGRGPARSLAPAHNIKTPRQAQQRSS